MKRQDNRQNKSMQIRPRREGWARESMPMKDDLTDLTLGGTRKGGTVLALVSSMLVATKIAQTAKLCHLGVRNFDRAEALMAYAAQHPPMVIVLDWDQCESEAFKILNELKKNADLQKVASIGYVSNTKQAVKQDAERAGCHRVYTKTEFMRDLALILTRYAQ